ncbi:hypothetical protein [Nocardia harenae]|uniref:hypothetical protein n=1 Tax=Nocardia harenae TaxID=358707 RepID=UPI0008317E1A|nr:hypothetical protein [Nocardia harenae]
MARTDRWVEDRRAEYRYGDRWSEEERDERPSGQWPRVEDDDEGDRGPLVNPYAVIALVGALLLLFPIALVFGLIAFAHPRGKTMAVFALLLGSAEAAVLAGLFVLGGSAWEDVLDRAQNTVRDTSQTSAVSLPQAPAPTLPATVAVPTTGDAGPGAPEPVATVAREGASCTEVPVGAIGTTADGDTMLCLGSSAGQTWIGPFTINTTVQQPGGSCDPSKGKSARTGDNRALICENGSRGTVWGLWTTE